jgi:hypothetical protein
MKLSKLNKRDREGARVKLAKAGLTERQLDALEDMVISDAVLWAEQLACTTDNKVTHRIGGIGSVLSFAGARHACEAVRVAVYWYHKKSGHLQPMPEGNEYEPIPYTSTWRPQS